MKLLAPGTPISAEAPRGVLPLGFEMTNVADAIRFVNNNVDIAELVRFYKTGPDESHKSNIVPWYDENGTCKGFITSQQMINYLMEMS